MRVSSVLEGCGVVVIVYLSEVDCIGVEEVLREGE